MTTDVETLLTDKKIEFVPKGKDILIRCLNPEHEDASPSLRIDREGGAFHCLSCGYKGNIFSFFNRQRNYLSAKVRKIQKAITDIRKASWPGYELPQDAFFVDTEFRGISAEIMKKFQGFRTHTMGMESRVVFPIYDSSARLVAFQGRLEWSDANPRYLAYPAETSLPWFPSVNQIKHNGTIFLVEGIRDALVLHSKGIENAVCVFGTKSISMDNIEEHLNPYLLLGLHRVIILFDGDSAGRSAAKHVETCISRKTDLEVIVENLPDDCDPASMTDQQLNTLTKVYKQEY